MKDFEWTPKRVVSTACAAVLVMFLLSLFFGGYVIVDAGHSGVVRRLGQVQDGSLPEGFHFKMPWLDDVDSYDCTVKKHVVDATAGSKDLQQISAKVAVNYRFVATKAPDIRRAVTFGTFADTVLDPATQESVKAVVARYNAEELLTKRPLVTKEMSEALTEKLNDVLPGAFLVVSFNVTDFDFSKAFNDAIEAKQVAEQTAQRARNEVLQEKAEADKKIEQARGQAESRRLNAQAEADAIRVEADAHAHAIEAEAAALKDNPMLIELRRIERWDGTLPRIVTGKEGAMFLQVGQSAGQSAGQ